MTLPRKDLVCVEDTPYYHVVSRCVRRTFLCGKDHSTGKSYDHRRQWIADRIRLLSSLFAIDICAYAVMSNHFHIVLRLCPEETGDLSPAEVVQRWTSLFKGPLLIQKWQSGNPLRPVELDAVNNSISVYRKRLGSLSWFMKCLNEPIAREANKEDGCTGHFWESRFKSQALRTEQALLSCMAYVDLNPIRAGIAGTPEESEYTSIQERITPKFNPKEAIENQVHQCALRHFDLPLKPLAALNGSINSCGKNTILFAKNDYLELVDFTGRIIRPDKRGTIPLLLPLILQRLKIKRKEWVDNSTGFEKCFHNKFGKRKKINNRVA